MTVLLVLLVGLPLLALVLLRRAERQHLRALDRERQLRVRLEQLRGQRRLQRLTHAALSELLDEGRRQQRRSAS